MRYQRFGNDAPQKTGGSSRMRSLLGFVLTGFRIRVLPLSEIDSIFTDEYNRNIEYRRESHAWI